MWFSLYSTVEGGVGAGTDPRRAGRRPDVPVGPGPMRRGAWRGASGRRGWLSAGQGQQLPVGPALDVVVAAFQDRGGPGGQVTATQRPGRADRLFPVGVLGDGPLRRVG